MISENRTVFSQGLQTCIVPALVGGKSDLTLMLFICSRRPAQTEFETQFKTLPLIHKITVNGQSAPKRYVTGIFNGPRPDRRFIICARGLKCKLESISIH